MRQLESRVWRPGSLLLATIALAAACTDSPTAPLNTTARHPLDLSAEWSLTSPTVEGVDSTTLAAAYSRASILPGLASLLVVRHGHLVGGRTFSVDERIRRIRRDRSPRA